MFEDKKKGKWRFLSFFRVITFLNFDHELFRGRMEGNGLEKVNTRSKKTLDQGDCYVAHHRD